MREQRCSRYMEFGDIDATGKTVKIDEKQFRLDVGRVTELVAPLTHLAGVRDYASAPYLRPASMNARKFSGLASSSTTPVPSKKPPSPATLRSRSLT